MFIERNPKEVAEEALPEEAVKEEITDSLGIRTAAVNVNISGIIFDTGGKSQ